MTETAADNTLSSKEIVYQCVEDLAAAGFPVAHRARVTALTGLSATIVDDSFDALITDERLRKTTPGYVELVDRFCDDEAISKTVLKGGLTIVEVGEQMMGLSPRAARVVGQMLVGDALMTMRIQSEREIHDNLTRLEKKNVLLERQINALNRQIRAATKQADLFAKEAIKKAQGAAIKRSKS